MFKTLLLYRLCLFTFFQRMQYADWFNNFQHFFKRRNTYESSKNYYSKLEKMDFSIDAYKEKNNITIIVHYYAR